MEPFTLKCTLYWSWHPCCQPVGSGRFCWNSSYQRICSDPQPCTQWECSAEASQNHRLVGLDLRASPTPTCHWLGTPQLRLPHGFGPLQNGAPTVLCWHPINCRHALWVDEVRCHGFELQEHKVHPKVVYARHLYYILFLYFYFLDVPSLQMTWEPKHRCVLCSRVRL